MDKEVLKKNIEQMVKILEDMKVMCVLLHRTAQVVGINDKEDGYLYTFLKSVTPEDIEDGVLLLKSKLEKLDQEELYVVKAEIGKEVTVQKVEVVKNTDKLYKVNDCMGYNQINKSELGTVKSQGNTIFTFVTNVEEGNKVIIKAVNDNMESIRERLKEYSSILAKMGKDKK